VTGSTRGQLIGVSGLLALQLAEPTGEVWTQVSEILFALVLSSAIGLERELGQENAGLRTHAGNC
jgi:hypothetical protein